MRKQANNQDCPVIGIDLGTTFTKFTYWDGREPRVYENNRGHKATPSVLYRSPKTGEILVGELAEQRGRMDEDAGNVVIGVKRRMDKGSEPIPFGDQTYTPIQLSSLILKHVYDHVKQGHPGYKPRGMVVTVPYHFKVHQCENTRRAAIEAGINCTGIIQEPIAAGLYYAWDRAIRGEECDNLILVFDLGGGTFDLTLFRLKLTAKLLEFEVVGTAGDDRLGGMDFDDAIVDLIIRKEEFSFEGASNLHRLKGMQKIREAAVDAKIALGMSDPALVIVSDVLPGKHIDISISREEYTEAIKKHLDRIPPIMDDLWRVTGKAASDVDKVILVGGSSRLFCIRDILGGIFDPDKVFVVDNLQTSIAEGASMYAAYIDDPTVFDREIRVITRTGYALGVKTSGGGFFTLITRNRPTPCAYRQQFRTTEDNMEEISIEVFQGSEKARRAEDNTYVGKVVVDDLPPRPKGLPVLVTFSVNKEQVLSVSVEVEGVRKDKTFTVAGTDAAA